MFFIGPSRASHSARPAILRGRLEVQFFDPVVYRHLLGWSVEDALRVLAGRKIPAISWCR